MALAFFITFSTYGTWLHGTDKGKGSVGREQNAHGESFLQPSQNLEASMRDAMTQPAYALDAPRREIVCDAIVAMAHDKGWTLLAAHVRSNHIHVVIQADRDPGRLMSDLKARASRDLTRAGFDTADRHRWTRHGSTLHLFTPAQVQEKIEYTLHRQGAPMAFFDGRNDPRTQ